MTIEVQIKPASTFVLVHDVVNDFIDAAAPGYDPELEPMLDNIQALLAAVRQAGLPIVFIGPGQGDPSIPPAHSEDGRLAWGSVGVDVPPSLGPLLGERIVRKPRWGGFYGSELSEYVRGAGLDTMIICGLSLAGGVETTVRDAYNRDLQSIVVSDACLCRPLPDQGWGPVSREDALRVTLSVLAQRFARVATVSEISAELARLAPVPGRR